MRFLTHTELSDAIRKVTHGTNVRCAIAFWGGGSISLFPENNIREVRIICNINLGGTPYLALNELCHKIKTVVKHFNNFHAKVYVSNRGAVVGSANASRNGIGFGELPAFVEAGFFIEPGSEEFRRIEDWFEKLWLSSKPVDQAALDLAKRRFRAGRLFSERFVQAGSLLDLIAADPDAFDDVSIAFVHTQVSPETKQRTRADIEIKHPESVQEIQNLSDDGIYANWSQSDLDRWRPLLIEFWMPRDILYVNGRRLRFTSVDNGAVMTQRDWVAVRKNVEGKRILEHRLPTIEEINEIDRVAARKIKAKYGNRLFTAHELAVALEELI